METIQDTLSKIIVLLKPSCTDFNHVTFYTDLARRLSVIAGKKPFWSWRYIMSIQSNSIHPSPRISQAAVSLLSLLDADRVNQYPGNIVQVRSLAGKVLPGSWIIGSSKVCSDPGCTIHFVPNVPWQKFCPVHTKRR